MAVTALADFRDVIASSQPFRGFEDDDLDHLLAACERIDAEAGETILDEGLPGPGLFVVLQGAVECFIPNRDEHSRRPVRVFFRVEAEGECFGELSLIDRKVASASVRATEPSVLCLLRVAEFDRLVHESERVGRMLYQNLLEHLVSRLREKDEELDELEFL